MLAGDARFRVVQRIPLREFLPLNSNRIEHGFDRRVIEPRLSRKEEICTNSIEIFHDCPMNVGVDPANFRRERVLANENFNARAFSLSK